MSFLFLTFAKYFERKLFINKFNFKNHEKINETKFG
jgi:hypothetical protein